MRVGKAVAESAQTAGPGRGMRAQKEEAEATTVEATGVETVAEEAADELVGTEGGGQERGGGPEVNVGQHLVALRETGAVAAGRKEPREEAVIASSFARAVDAAVAALTPGLGPGATRRSKLSPRS